jgi:hypothetical protein
MSPFEMMIQAWRLTGVLKHEGERRSWACSLHERSKDIVNVSRGVLSSIDGEDLQPTHSGATKDACSRAVKRKCFTLIGSRDILCTSGSWCCFLIAAWLREPRPMARA